jgi:type I restriction enzyme M protein
LYQSQNRDLQDEILKYETFTDIEFNPKKSINCQARPVAIFISSSRQSLLDKTLRNSDSFRAIDKKIDFANTMIAAPAPTLFKS